MFRKLGFFIFVLGLALPAWGGTFVVRALERFSFECARIWKTLFAYQFIVRAKAK